MRKPRIANRRGLETEKELEDSFIALSLEKGFESVSVKDVTDRTGLDRSTFYLHFKDLDDLVVRTQKRFIDGVIPELGRIRAPLEGLETVFRHVVKHRNIYRTFLKIHGKSGAVSLLEEYALERIKNLFLGDKAFLKSLSIPRGLAVNFIAVTVRSSVLWWIEQDDPMDAGAMAAHVRTLILTGISGRGTPIH